mmetsp:Transcript_59021/g.175495  ORF Transcript_59021/g.175495 Transcript_59021/m.175495 type:complete len:158 (+) Transcript_59021:561-1034(+)
MKVSEPWAGCRSGSPQYHQVGFGPMMMVVFEQVVPLLQDLNRVRGNQVDTQYTTKDDLCITHLGRFASQSLTAQSVPPLAISRPFALGRKTAQVAIAELSSACCKTRQLSPPLPRLVRESSDTIFGTASVIETLPASSAMAKCAFPLPFFPGYENEI